MKQKYVADLAVDDVVTDFFMLKSMELKTDRRGKEYMDMQLGDMTGDITSKKWDVSNAEADAFSRLSAGAVVKVEAQVTEWNTNKQLKVLRMRVAGDNDDINMNDYIKAAPEDAEEMWRYLHDQANGIKDRGLRAVSLRALKDNKDKLLYWPAASRNHHAEKSGLLYHMKRMLMTGEAVCRVYRELNEDWIRAGVIVHDIEKINEIDSDEMGVSPGYSFEGQMLGHIVQGIKTIEKIADEEGLEYEKKIMLQHMILSHHYEPEFGSPKKPLFPEAELLHYLDIIDARMYDMQEALLGVDAGGFSEMIKVLDNRRIYKPEED